MSSHSRSLIRAAIASSTVAVITLLVSVVNGKVKAVVLGTAGVGTLAQLMMFQGTVTALCSMGLPFAMLKYVAQYRAANSLQDLRAAVWIPLGISGGLGVLAAVFVSLYCGPLAATLLKLESDAAHLVVIAAVALPVSVFAVNVVAVVMAFQDNRLYTRVNLLASLLTLPVFVSLVYWLGLMGSVIGLFVLPFVQILLAVFGLRRKYRELFVGKASYLFSGSSLRIAGGIFSLGLIQVVMANNNNICSLITRTTFIHAFGLEANGLYQGAASISGMNLMLALGFLNLYAFPKVSETRDTEMVNTITQETVRFTVIIMTLVVAGTIAFGRLLVSLLLSKDFLLAANFLPLQASGDFMYALGTATAVGVLSVAPKRVWAMLAIVLAWARILSFFISIKWLQLYAAPFSYFLGSAIYALICVLTMHRYSGLNISRSTCSLLFRSLAAVVAITLMSNGTLVWTTGSLAIILAWLVGAVTRDEWTSIRRVVINKVLNLVKSYLGS